jgi:hypothetical protein
MARPIWISEHYSPRAWARRTPGRRAGDRRLRVETFLVAGAVIAWAWCAFEVVRLFAH